MNQDMVRFGKSALPLGQSGENILSAYEDRDGETRIAYGHGSLCYLHGPDALAFWRWMDSLAAPDDSVEREHDVLVQYSDYQRQKSKDCAQVDRLISVWCDAPIAERMKSLCCVSYAKETAHRGLWSVGLDARYDFDMACDNIVALGKNGAKRQYHL